MMACMLPLNFVGLSTVYLGFAEGNYAAALERLGSERCADPGATASNIVSSRRLIGEKRRWISQLRGSINRAAGLNDQSALFDLCKDNDLLNDPLNDTHKESLLVEVAPLKITASDCAEIVAETPLCTFGEHGRKRGIPAERAANVAKTGVRSNGILKVIIDCRELGSPYQWGTEPQPAT
jgi:hypothetical protein